MALTTCKECDGQLSDKASNCPHCGAPSNIALQEKVKQYFRKCRYCGLEHAVGEAICPYCNKDNGGNIRKICPNCGQLDYYNNRKCWNCGQRTKKSRGLISEIFYYIMLTPVAFGLLAAWVWFFDPFDSLYSRTEKAADFEALRVSLRNVSPQSGTYEVAFSNNLAPEPVTVYSYIILINGITICPTSHLLSRTSIRDIVDCPTLKLFEGGFGPYRLGISNRPNALPGEAGDDYRNGTGRGRVKGFM